MPKHRRCCDPSTPDRRDLCDVHRFEHDIAELVKAYSTLCAFAGGGKQSAAGVKEGDPSPINLTLLEYLNGHYEEQALDDEGTVVGVNYLPGVTPTILWSDGIIATTRAALDETAPLRKEPESRHATTVLLTDPQGEPGAPDYVPAEPHSATCACGWTEPHAGWLASFAAADHLREAGELAPNPWVLEDLNWLRRQAGRVVQDAATSRWVGDHVWRLAHRGSKLLDWETLVPGWNRCLTCRLVDRWFPQGSLLVSPARMERVTVDGVTRIVRSPSTAVCCSPGCSARGEDNEPASWRQNDVQEWVRTTLPRKDWLGREIKRPSMSKISWMAVTCQDPRLANAAAYY